MGSIQKTKNSIRLRLTDYNLHKKIYADPRIGMKYHISDDIALKANWGLYHQFLTTANNQDENLRLVELWWVSKRKTRQCLRARYWWCRYMSPRNIFYRIELYQKRLKICSHLNKTMQMNMRVHLKIQL